MAQQADPIKLPSEIGPELVLLDRDGVLNRNLDRGLRSEADWVWLPGAIVAARLMLHSARVMVLTNQANIGRGLLTVRRLTAIHNRMLLELGDDGLTIADVLYCPHRSSDGCQCRKPGPGLVLAALQRAGVAAERTLLVGDHESDIAAAAAAGCWSLHVRTGRGDRPAHAAPRYLGSVPDLSSAARMVAAARQRHSGGGQ